MIFPRGYRGHRGSTFVSARRLGVQLLDRGLHRLGPLLELLLALGPGALRIVRYTLPPGAHHAFFQDHFCERPPLLGVRQWRLDEVVQYGLEQLVLTAPSETVAPSPFGCRHRLPLTPLLLQVLKKRVVSLRPELSVAERRLGAGAELLQGGGQPLPGHLHLFAM